MVQRHHALRNWLHTQAKERCGIKAAMEQPWPAMDRNRPADPPSVPGVMDVVIDNAGVDFPVDITIANVMTDNPLEAVRRTRFLEELHDRRRGRSMSPTAPT